MDAVGVIPARYGSTRFPGKPLVEIAGKPLLTHVIEGAKQAKRLSQILVATDDERIARAAAASGAKAVMTDPELPCGTDRVWAALVAAGLTDIDVAVNIHGDEPLIEGEPLDALVGAFEGADRSAIEMATLGREMDLATPQGLEALTASTTAKIVVDVNDRALYFSRFPIPFSRISSADAVRQGEFEAVGKCVLKHVGIYAYRPSFLKRFCQTSSDLERFEGLEQLRALSMGAAIHVVRTKHESWGVDTPGDVEKIEKMLKEFPHASRR
ncbi:MAG: 3-deoxy-manno-octulosonate cytidylyltransferase [Bdellovibrionales bacterium]|jgi:3-deoxy-manno-octulosonate cytidylyltransferase (CMP-KDO synthetase)|nr:3-deoxy-manno-octulosonate cytidylyltransferase [Bdellovibrionales bacterium]